MTTGSADWVGAVDFATPGVAVTEDFVATGEAVAVGEAAPVARVLGDEATGGLCVVVATAWDTGAAVVVTAVADAFAEAEAS